MKSAFAFVFFLSVTILLLGCAARAPVEGTPGNAHQPEPTANSDSAPPPPSTANLSFSRDASDVMNTETKPFTPPRFDFTNVTTSDDRLIVNYFYSKYCSACQALRPEIDRLEGEYAKVEWREYDITTQNGTYAYQQYANEAGLNQSQRLVPQVLVNGTVITDRFNINSSLEGIIAAFNAGQS
jgi:thiol-disulfide isomerase/thioredoxin